MATFDMTSSATGGVNADSIAAHNSSEKIAYSMEAVLDIASITGYSCTNGDIFQLLEIPANSVILSAGCEVLTAFNGTSPTIDVGTNAGDTIIDGGDAATAGYPAKGTNGAVLGTFSALVTTADTIDVKLIAASNDVTSGKLRVWAVVADIADKSAAATSAARDALA